MNKLSDKAIYAYALTHFNKEHVCPYCRGTLRESYTACCGEAGHGIDVFLDPSSGEALCPEDDREALKYAVCCEIDLNEERGAEQAYDTTKEKG